MTFSDLLNNDTDFGKAYLWFWVVWLPQATRYQCDHRWGSSRSVKSITRIAGYGIPDSGERIAIPWTRLGRM